ncbi:uncharacterized protein STEHIDRAFT_147415 [Stereum hirsutum FP-91666 SS1]|uniref:uncharacterized protein n=1 Tax=Stereum hirsutum (strain FP-91666) TaxID=721885 RepID=UPI0004449BEC|nr:uncharacterized protein STEHIDRAFT_147415 [Stereum hirsutum FP-91666 SS1]EIM85781.1 hypothetical protein STEHIDRAFT_147415 [Stereum hirsutum FP-91666 SS1]
MVAYLSISRLPSPQNKKNVSSIYYPKTRHVPRIRRSPHRSFPNEPPIPNPHSSSHPLTWRRSSIGARQRNGKKFVTTWKFHQYRLSI